MVVGDSCQLTGYWGFVPFGMEVWKKVPMWGNFQYIDGMIEKYFKYFKWVENGFSISRFPT